LASSRDGGAVPRGHPIAQVERSQHRAQQAHLQAGELLGPLAELLGAVLGTQQRREQVLEGQQNAGEQGERPGAVGQRDLGDADRHERGDQVGGEQRDERLARGLADRAAGRDAAVARDQHEVDAERDGEEREDHTDERDVVRLEIKRVVRPLKREAAGEREGRVDRNVRQDDPRLLAVLDRTGKHGEHADRGGRRAAQQDHRDDDREKAA
jgi:hypothetical protein